MKQKKSPRQGQIAASREWKSSQLIIRYPKSADWKSAWKYINELSAERTFILMQGNKVTQKQEKIFIESILKQMKLKTGIHLFLTDENAVIGSAGITLKRFAEKHVGVLGLSVAPKYRDGGIGTWFMETLLVEAKLQLPELTQVVLEVFANNPRAKHVYEKLGFKEYGRLPNGLKHVGKLVDAISMYRSI